MNQEVPAEDTDWRPKTTAKARHLQESSTDGSTVTIDDENPISSGRAEMVSRPEKTLFHQAMAGLDRGQRHFYVHDYPWRDLGAGTVVDVGGGIGVYTPIVTISRPRTRSSSTKPQSSCFFFFFSEIQRPPTWTLD